MQCIRFKMITDSIVFFAFIVSLNNTKSCENDIADEI